MYSILKIKIKTSIWKRAQRPHLHNTISENRWTEQNELRADHTSPANQITSNNHNEYSNVNQLMPESSSTNNSRTASAQAETSTVVIPKPAIGRIIVRKGNKVNKIQAQNNAAITTSLTYGPDCKFQHRNNIEIKKQSTTQWECLF